MANPFTGAGCGSAHVPNMRQKGTTLDDVYPPVPTRAGAGELDGAGRQAGRGTHRDGIETAAPWAVPGDVSADYVRRLELLGKWHAPL